MMTTNCTQLCMYFLTCMLYTLTHTCTHHCRFHWKLHVQSYGLMAFHCALETRNTQRFAVSSLFCTTQTIPLKLESHLLGGRNRTKQINGSNEQMCADLTDGVDERKRQGSSAQFFLLAILNAENWFLATYLLCVFVWVILWPIHSSYLSMIVVQWRTISLVQHRSDHEICPLSLFLSTNVSFFCW